MAPLCGCAFWVEWGGRGGHHFKAEHEPVRRLLRVADAIHQVGNGVSRLGNQHLPSVSAVPKKRQVPDQPIHVPVANPCDGLRSRKCAHQKCDAQPLHSSASVSPHF